jgi:mannose-1-phosphate guanylyltransferase
MLSLFEERTLFQTAVGRLEGVFDPEHTLVVTVASQAEELHAQCPQIPQGNFLIEPMPRGTASVVGLAAVALQKRDPDAVMAILTSDHYMKDEERFRQLLQAARDIAGDGYLVTLGVEPAFPATGYGYIQQGEKIGEARGLDVFKVLRFKEKPDEAQAREMIASGDHVWNSGMFVWRVDRILEEFAHQMPGLKESLDEIAVAWGTSGQAAVVERVWPSLRSETIDYGIMEGAGRVAVISAAGLGWSDVGSWDSLFGLVEGDENGNIVLGGDFIGLDTRESLIYMNKEHRLIVTIGVEDLVVVDTGDVLLVCRKDQAQRVRQVVSKLKENGQDFL